MSDELKGPGSGHQAPVDAVLIIDGDNDPHIPPEFPVTDNTLVRVFLRPDGKLPRGLERRFGTLPLFAPVNSTRGGANAADFVMSFHIGILHSTLPMHIHFMIVTADKSLSVVAQELQRVGRQAVLWTSHPERGGKSRTSTSEAAAKPASGRGRSRRGGRGRTRSRAAAPAAEVVATPIVDIPVIDVEGPASTETIEAPVAAPRAGKSLSQVAAAYVARLARIKGPPSRLKTLLNDIKNRTANTGFSPEDVLEELKQLGRVAVDDKGKVSFGAKGG